MIWQGNDCSKWWILYKIVNTAKSFGGPCPPGLGEKNQLCVAAFGRNPLCLQIRALI